MVVAQHPDDWSIMDQEVMALKVSSLDNVATIFSEEGHRGTTVIVRDSAGATSTVTLRDNVPFGHKLAVRALGAGEPVIKYGEEIGVASRDIAIGDYVHVHNLDSMRGRGDLERTAQGGGSHA